MLEWVGDSRANDEDLLELYEHSNRVYHSAILTHATHQYFLSRRRFIRVALLTRNTERLQQWIKHKYLFTASVTGTCAAVSMWLLFVFKM